MKDVFTNRRNDYQQNNNDDQNLYNNNGGQENKPKSPGKVFLRTVYIKVVCSKLELQVLF